MSVSDRRPPAAYGKALTDPAALLGVLRGWSERGWLRALDLAFAEFLLAEVAAAPALLILAAALASHQLGRGHAALDLAATLADPTLALSLPPEADADDYAVDNSAGTLAASGDERVVLPAALLGGLTLARWLAAIEQPELVAAGAGAGTASTPLVLVGARLYLRRYWQYEADLRTAIAQRLERTAALQAALPVDRLRAVLGALFERQTSPSAPASTPATAVDWQQVACALAARSAFAVITGGPGTGKTTTVVRLLALLQALALGAGGSIGDAAGRPLRIRLAAPTGKAAARLNAAIAGAVARLPLAAIADGEAIRASIPVSVSTLHRLLGSRPDTRHFRHHAGNPLALDVLVVDEASMIDLEMMTALLAALPASARLVVLGDKDQLASVEAGAVLGELCRNAVAGRYTLATADWLAAVCGGRIDAQLIDAAGSALDQSVVMLRHSYRFAAASGIGRLAAAVNDGDGAALRALWREKCGDLALLPLAARDDGRSDGNQGFAALVVDGGTGSASSAASAAPRRGYRHYLETLRREQPALDAPAPDFDAWARSVLAAHASFQVLCAVRRGRWGVDAINRRIADELRAAGLIPASDGWYLGRPVLVTRNDYALGLMNGDIGITLARPAPDGSGWKLRVAFAAGDDAQGVKWVLPSRLQAVDTVYALTVHKSQGSEFTHAALLVPDTPSPILTRELVYTAITRARDWLTLAHAGRHEIVEQAIGRRVLRSSGLLAEV